MHTLVLKNRKRSEDSSPSWIDRDARQLRSNVSHQQRRASAISTPKSAIYADD